MVPEPGEVNVKNIRIGLEIQHDVDEILRQVTDFLNTRLDKHLGTKFAGICFDRNSEGEPVANVLMYSEEEEKGRLFAAGGQDFSIKASTEVINATEEESKRWNKPTIRIRDQRVPIKQVSVQWKPETHTDYTVIDKDNGDAMANFLSGGEPKNVNIAVIIGSMSVENGLRRILNLENTPGSDPKVPSLRTEQQLIMLEQALYRGSGNSTKI